MPEKSENESYSPEIFRCNLHNSLAGVLENALAGRFADSIDMTNSYLGNRTFMQIVGELQNHQKHRETHTIAITGLPGPGRPLTHPDTLQQTSGHHDISGMRQHTGPETRTAQESQAPLSSTVMDGKTDVNSPLQMVTARMRQLIPNTFKLNRFIPGTYTDRSPNLYKHDDIGTLMKNYRMGGTSKTGFSRPLSILNRLAIAHITGDDIFLLKRAYCTNWWPGYNCPTPQRPTLQHLGQLLDETSARTAGGRYLRITSASTDALSQGDKVIMPTFNPAELIQTPRMFGLPFIFYTEQIHFGMQTDESEKVIIELIIPDNHRLGLPYGTLGDAKYLYAPHLISPWVYIIDKISVVGTGFREAKQAVKFVEAYHSFLKFIKLRALKQTDLNEMITAASTVRDLYTGRNLPLNDLVDVYTHLHRHRTSEDLPPIDMMPYCFGS